MKKLFPICAMLALPCFAEATVLTFDDIAFDPVSTVAIPDGYGGMNWQGAKVINPITYGNGSMFDTYGHGIVSGTNLAISMPVMTISSSSPFTALGAYFGSGSGMQGIGLSIEASLNGIPVFTISKTLLEGETEFLSFYSAQVDTLVLYAGELPQGFPISTFTMDDFEFERPISVPEPGSLSILGLGLVCVGFAFRKRHWGTVVN